MKALCAAIGLIGCVAPARAELMLFARYDWQDGASDVSGSPIRHDGVLQSGASIEEGKLVVASWYGVELGRLPELEGATDVLLRFEDVTFSSEPEERTGFGVLAGSDDSWWVAVYSHRVGNGLQTSLEFNLGGYGDEDGLSVVIADEPVYHFDSIEYRLNGTAPLAERFSVRWDDGPWITGGVGVDAFHAIPSAEEVRIHNGGPADWDPMWATLGTVSFYSNQIPEPSAPALAIVGLIGLLAWQRRKWKN